MTLTSEQRLEYLSFTTSTHNHSKRRVVPLKDALKELRRIKENG